MNKQMQEKVQKESKIFKCAEFILLRTCYKWDTSKDLLHKICFKFCTFNSNFSRLISSKFYHPSTGTTDDGVLTSMIHKYRVFFFPSLTDKCLPNAQLVLCHTPGLGRVGEGREKKNRCDNNPQKF